MMKKILFVVETLNFGGGVVRGLQNMLAMLPSDTYDISILSMQYSDIENVHLDNCTILENDLLLTAVTSNYRHTVNYRHRNILKVIKVILTLLSKISLRTTFENYLYRCIARKYKNYDKVIAYQEGLPTHFAQYIHTPCRISWIHCDYHQRKININYDEETVYSRYNDIVCVSKYTLESFRRIYPSLRNKSLYIHNILNKKYICEAANETVEDFMSDATTVKLVSLGRIVPVKQFHLIPSIISKMIALGARRFKWYLLGSADDAVEYSLLQDELKKYNVDDQYFTFLGSRYNPYPYIKNSDILVSTSRSEACPYVVNEARILGVPVVSSNYPSVYEFIEDNVNGCICPIEDMAAVLSRLIINRDEYQKIEAGMKRNDYDNNAIIKKITEFLDK